MLKEAKASARASVVARFAKQEVAEAGARAAGEAAQQEVDFAVLHQQVDGINWERSELYHFAEVEPSINRLPCFGQPCFVHTSDRNRYGGSRQDRGPKCIPPSSSHAQPLSLL